jgi:hypothetical protein
MVQQVCVVVSATERESSWPRRGRPNRPRKHIKPTRIVLASADRHSAQRVAQSIGISRPTVWRWQQRFAESGVEGLLRDKTRKPGKSRPLRKRQRKWPSQGAGLAGAPSALDLPLHSDLGLLAQRRREFLFEDDAAAHPPRRLPLDRRPAGRHQCLSRRAQCQPQTLCLDPIRRGHFGQTRPLPCTFGLIQCTSWFARLLHMRCAIYRCLRCPDEQFWRTTPGSRGCRFRHCRRSPGARNDRPRYRAAGRGGMAG